MTKTKLVQCKVDFPMSLWHKRLMDSKERIGLFMAAQIQTNRGMLFNQEGAYNGRAKWAPLKSRSGMILSKTGVLRKSLAPPTMDGKAGPNGLVKISGSVKDLSVSVASKLAYANMMNYGTSGLPDGVLKPIHKSVLRFKSGDKWVFAHEVKIPPRNFLSWNNQDKKELRAALTGLVVEILNGK